MTVYFKVTNTGNYTIYLDITNVSQDIQNNRSKVQYKAYITGASGTSAWGTGTWSLNINGTTSSGSVTYNFNSQKTWYCVGDGSTYVTSAYISHNSDGSKSIPVEFTFNGTSLVGSASISQNFALNTIPRASDVTVSAYTIANTTGSLSATITPKATVFYHKWRWKIGSGSWSSWTSEDNITSATSVTVANTSLLEGMPTSTVATFSIEVATYSDSNYSTLVGTKSDTASVTVDTSAIKPTCILSTIAVYSSPISGYAVAGYSTVRSRATVDKSSGATSCTTYFSTSKGTLVSSSSTSTSAQSRPWATTNTLPASKTDYTLTISAYAVDSRGAVSDTATQSITVYGYQPPQATLTAYRTATNASSDTTEDEAGLYVYVAFSGAVRSSVNGQNTIASDGIVCTYDGSISGTASSGDHYRLTSGQSVTFTLTVTDSVSSTTVTRLVTPARYPLDLYDDGEGTVGVGFATTAVGGAVSSALPVVTKSTDRPRFLARDLTHNGDIRMSWDSAHRVHGLYSIGYSTDGATLTTDSIWMIQRTATGAVLVNGVNIPDDLFYKAGDTITLTTGVMNGWVTSSSKNIQVYLSLSKRLDNISSINVTKFIMTVRGIAGYVEGSTQFDYTQNSDYSISYALDKVSNGILFTIGKTSAAYTGATNNTVVSALIRNIVLELS